MMKLPAQSLPWQSFPASCPHSLPRPAGGGSPLDQPRRQSPAAAELPLWPFWEDLRHRPLCQGEAGTRGPLGPHQGCSLQGPHTAACHHRGVTALCLLLGGFLGVPYARVGGRGAAAVWGVGEPLVPQGGEHLCLALVVSPTVCQGPWQEPGAAPPPWHTLPLTDELRAVAGLGGRERH